MQAGKFWNGVGHRVAAGDGARNPFGVAFEAAGEVSLVKPLVPDKIIIHCPILDLNLMI